MKLSTIFLCLAARTAVAVPVYLQKSKDDAPVNQGLLNLGLDKPDVAPKTDNNAKTIAQLDKDLAWILDSHTKFYKNSVNPAASFLTKATADAGKCFTLVRDGSVSANFEGDNADQIDAYFFKEIEKDAITVKSSKDYYTGPKAFLDQHGDMININNIEVKMPAFDTRIGCFNAAADATAARKYIDELLFQTHVSRLKTHIRATEQKLGPRP